MQNSAQVGWGLSPLGEAHSPLFTESVFSVVDVAIKFTVSGPEACHGQRLCPCSVLSTEDGV